MRFSVLMAVYISDVPIYFSQALESLASQTLKPSEVVLVEDGPISFELAKIIEDYKDVLNIVSIRLKINQGLSAALNAGLIHCSNELVARMDSDDICLPCRFALQVEFMNNNSTISVSSSWIREFDDSTGYSYIRKLPKDHSDLYLFSKYRCPIAHPVSIFRKSIIIKIGGYPNFRKAQDYSLWAVVLRSGYKIANLQTVLLDMRVSNAFDSGRGFEHLKNEFKMFAFQYKIGHISFYEMLRNILIRFLLRTMPKNIKMFFYSNFR